jgi:prepilin-type N-terminal cleavage/methylation domain-containing protein
MILKKRAAGFSLIELMLVLAIMGIIAGIAIPAFLTQRRRARVIGDAQANAQVLRMQMETYKADSGVYGTAGNTYTWSWTSSTPTAGGSAAAALNFLPKGNSRMNYSVAIGSGGLLYTIKVMDPTLGASYVVYTVNQNGSATITPY